jgi:hypothetical protein
MTTNHIENLDAALIRPGLCCTHHTLYALLTIFPMLYQADVTSRWR